MSHLGKTLALTPALSPRRGRAIVRLFTLCPSRLQSAPSCVLFRKQYDHPTRSYRPHAGERFTLSWGERAGVRASVPLTFLPLLHSNTSRNPTGPAHFAESIAFAPDFQGIGSSTVNRSAMRIKCSVLCRFRQRVAFAKRQRTAALQDADALAAAPFRFMAPMRVQSWKSKLSPNR